MRKPRCAACQIRCWSAATFQSVWTSTGTGTEKDWREEISFWKKAGVTHVTLHNTFGGYHHKRMAGRSMTDHVDAMRRYSNAVADLL